MNKKIMRYAIIGALHNEDYLAVWTIAELLDVPLTEFGGAGTSGAWNDVLLSLVSEGIAEEVPDLGYRYRLAE